MTDAVACFDELFGHLTHQDSGILLCEMENGVINAETSDQSTFLFGGIAYGSDDPKKIETRDCVFVTELLNRTGEYFGYCKGRSNGRGKTYKFLQRFEHRLECIL